jgi:ribonucleotide reductase alpha subunit
MLPSQLKSLIEEYCMGIQPTDTQIDEIMDLAISLSADSSEVAQYIEKMQQGPTKEERDAIAKAEAERKAKEEAKRKAEAERKAKDEAERKAKESADKKAKREAAVKWYLKSAEQERKEREYAVRRAQEELQQKKKKQQKIRRRLLIEFILTWVLCIVVFITSDLSFFESTLFSILLYLCILFIEFLSWAQRRLGN